MDAPGAEIALDPALDEEETLKLLAEGGPLSCSLQGFETRPQQQAMLRDVLNAFNHNTIALIEAGTGTGKSLAYLLPAILWAAKFGQRTVISTNTINLQEQLLLKDIPLLLKALKVPLKVALVKGMGNYLCLRKFEENKLEVPLMTAFEREEWDRLDRFRHTTHEGSRTSLPQVPSGALWEKVGAEHDTCTKRDCPYYKECFFYRARKQAEEAKILIVNHHLLCSDLVARNSNEEEGVLPDYQRVVIDEAHNLEEIATDFFATRFSQLGFLRNLGRLASEKFGKPHGKLPILKHLIQIHYRNGLPEEFASIFLRLNSELPHLRQILSDHLNRTCEAFRRFCVAMHGKKLDEESGLSEMRLRLMKPHQTHFLWEQEIVPHSKALIEDTYRYAQMLTSLEGDISRLNNEKLAEQLKGPLHEIRALAGRLTEACALLKTFLDAEVPSEKVRWIEVQQLRVGFNTLLFNADLDISSALAEALFKRFSTSILVSATLTTNKQFDFIRSRLGLTTENIDTKEVTEKIYEAPFNYREQALLLIPSDMPSPADPNFTAEAAERIWQALEASRGNAFVLFTSYTMLKACHELLRGRLQEKRYNILKQGDNNRQALLQDFKNIDKSVLFGTDSFWEGVDVVGEALRCVILVKLPFKVPTEPMIQARAEAITARGGDPFTEYSLPQAIVKFKQGFGRLIRNRKDRGCIVCLDQRLLTKNYGKQFLNSLPSCPHLVGTTPQIHQAMLDFYRKTYYLVNS